MKLNAPVTRAFPAALAIASIFLALVMLPGGAAPASSPGLAPALQAAAGDVVAAVSAPVHAIKTVHPNPKSAVSRAAAATATQPRTQPRSSPTSQAHSAPAHRPAHHRHVLRRAPVRTAPVTSPAPAAPAPAPSVTKHGKGKALGHLKRGHLKKLAAAPVPVSHAAIHTVPSASSSHGRGNAYGHSPDVSNGPPAVPPGHDRGGGK
jgi:hypothetical protein